MSSGYELLPQRSSEQSVASGTSRSDESERLGLRCLDVLLEARLSDKASVF